MDADEGATSVAIIYWLIVPASSSDLRHVHSRLVDLYKEWLPLTGARKRTIRFK